MVLPQVDQWLTIYPCLFLNSSLVFNTKTALYLYLCHFLCGFYIWFRAEILQYFITWIIFQYGLAVISYAFEAAKAAAESKVNSQ